MSQSRFASLKAGETDLVWADEFEADNIVRARKDADAAGALTMPAPAPPSYAFNTKVAPLDDVRVRQALVMAIDRKKMSQALTNGLARPASNPYGDGSWVKCKDDGAPARGSRQGRGADQGVRQAGQLQDAVHGDAARPRRRPGAAAVLEAGRAPRWRSSRSTRPTIVPRAFQRKFERHAAGASSISPIPIRRCMPTSSTAARRAGQLRQSRARQACSSRHASRADEAKRTEDYCAISRADQPGGDLVLDLPEHLLRRSPRPR